MARRADGSHTSQATERAAEHRAEREAWAPTVATGTVECRRGDQCRMQDHRILPGQAWDLGHPDNVCSAPTAPEHERCNRSTSTWKAQAKKRPAPAHPSQLTRASARGTQGGYPSPTPKTSGPRA
ncbi:hypothetical protein [Nocardioides aquiterrae]|uniref:HNH endonuclease n=1 Tax=Nocardioides aquiterrae TaxID=203799 RepID=A0ABP4EYX4_9ACTN